MKKQNLKDLFAFVDREDVQKRAGSWTNSPIILPYEIKPKDFLKFAEEDLEKDNLRASVNALSNIKRAIDCQVESLLYVFGFYKKAKKNDWNFLKKMEILLKVGVVAPNILKKINTKRNKLEHDFKKPKRTEIEDFRDVALLFLSNTDCFINRSDWNLEWYTMNKSVPLEKPHLDVKLDSKNGLFLLDLYKFSNLPKKIKISIDDEEEYMRVLKHWAKAIMEH